MQQLSDIESRFVEALRASAATAPANALATPDVAAKLGLTRNVCAFVLEELARKGVLAKTSEGRYHLKNP